MTHINFLIDTGADATCLHPLDADRCGVAAERLVDPGQWANSVRFGGVGGAAVYFPVPAIYTFRHHDGRVYGIEEQILVAQLRPENRSLPSILGWDVLQHFRLTLDWNRREITLE